MAPKDIDSYLATVDEPKRTTLEELRQSILAVIPDAEQCISYGMPAFKGAGQDRGQLRCIQESPELLAAQRIRTREASTAAAIR